MGFSNCSIRLSMCGAGAVAAAYGVFPDQALNPSLLRLLHWKTDFFTTGPPGKPVTQFEPFPISGLRTQERNKAGVFLSSR